MNLYEEIKKKIPFAYYIDGNILAVNGDKCNILSGSSAKRIYEWKRILEDTQNHTKKDIQVAIHEISSIASCFTEINDICKSYINLKDFISKLSDKQKEELEKEVTMFVNLYKEYMR